MHIFVTCDTITSSHINQKNKKFTSTQFVVLLLVKKKFWWLSDMMNTSELVTSLASQLASASYLTSCQLQEGLAFRFTIPLQLEKSVFICQSQFDTCIQNIS